MGFDVETNGFDELQDELNEMKETAQKLDGENEINFGELFNDSFMQDNTDFESIEAFFEKSPWTIENENDFDAIPESDLDDYVDEHTVFDDWEAMLGQAGENWVAKQLIG